MLCPRFLALAMGAVGSPYGTSRTLLDTPPAYVVPDTVETARISIAYDVPLLSPVITPLPGNAAQPPPFRRCW